MKRNDILEEAAVACIKAAIKFEHRFGNKPIVGLNRTIDPEEIRDIMHYCASIIRELKDAD